MMRAVPTQSLRSKLLVLVLVTTAAALLVSGTAMLLVDLKNFRRTWVSDLEAQAAILGYATQPAIDFDDPAAATEYLASLQAKPAITHAAIYTAKGTLFAKYQKKGVTAPFPEIAEKEGNYTEGNEIVVVQRIVADNEIIGSVFLRAHYDLVAHVSGYLGILAIVMLASLGAAALIAHGLQRSITGSIASVIAVARSILEKRQFSLRAKKTSNDEIGVLVDAFNDMLDEVGRRAEVLEASNSKLAEEMAERERAEEARRASERRQNALVAAMTQVVWTADWAGNFVDDQPSWMSYTGQARDAYAGLGWRVAVAEDDRAPLELAWAKAIQSGQPFELDLKLWHAASQSHRVVSLRAVPLGGADGEVREWTGTVTDIHEQRLAQGELKRLNAELEQRVEARTKQLEAANKELEAFSYSVSHDLRAPLRAINGFSTLLTADHAAQLDAEANRKIEIIRREAERMGVLIDDLLAFSRLGRRSIEPMALNMGRIVPEIFERIHECKDDNMSFRVGQLPDALGDRALIEQVWVNLLSNAIKFTSKKPDPTIEVGAISDESEHVFYVRDNGAGFDPRYEAKLFGVFQRLHDASEFPGTGVGLALVQRIVTRHGGRVWANGKPGEGATFHFTLPKENPGARVRAS